MNKNIWYSYDKVLSYNAMLNFIIGERGVGKSYGIKKGIVYLIMRLEIIDKSYASSKW